MARDGAGLRNKKINLLIVGFWFLYIYIWLWNPYNGYRTAWWFDDLGHFLYGFVGGATILYFTLNYGAKGAFLYVGNRLLIFFTCTTILAGSAVWELVEYKWDTFIQPAYFPWLDTAQNGLDDTMTDFFNAVWGMCGALCCWRMGRFLYQYLWPEETEKERRLYIADQIEEASCYIREQRRLHWHILRLRLIERLKEKRERRKNKTRTMD